MGTAEELKVNVDSAITIFPAEPTPSSTIFLSNIDQVLAYYVDTVYFYKCGSDDVVEVLKDSLSKLLVPYHFMAGRLKLNSEIGRIELECNSAGVLFAGATSGLAISDLGDISIPNPAFRKLILLPLVKAMCDAPLLTVQVTKFKCGGFAMGVYMSHCVIDGISALDFFKNYCSIARGEGIQMVPNPDRSMLKARTPPKITYEHPEYIKLVKQQQSAFTTFDTANGEFSSTSAPVKHVYRNFSFTEEMIASLKHKATAEDATITKCSTFEVVVAHVWQARTRAVEMNPELPSKLFFAVDFRNRIHPPLSKEFSGNGVVSAPCVTTLAKHVSDNNFAFCVKTVQEAIAAVTDEYVRSTIDHGEIHHGVPDLPGGIFISPWWRIPFQDLDFGWGRPVYAGPVVNERVEFVLLLHNGRRDNGLNVYLALEPLQMEKFEKNIIIS